MNHIRGPADDTKIEEEDPSHHQESINSLTNDDPRKKMGPSGGPEDAKMKRYLIKIFEKMQESNSSTGGGSLMMHNTTATSGALGCESPDPLLEHSNSV